MKKYSYIKLSRSILGWRWYKTPNTFRLFVHLILRANFCERDYEKITVKRGQLVTSVATLCRELKMSPRSVRTSLEHLKSTNEVTVETTSKYSLITVNNYEKYQTATNIPTNDRKASDKQPTSFRQQDKKEKEIKEFKRIYYKGRENTLAPQGQFENVFLTESELDRLRQDYPMIYQDKIERLSVYIASTGKQYQNHYAVLTDWLKADEDKDLANAKIQCSYDIDRLEEIDTLDFLD